ncbi:MAG TPA: hypothetical protein VGR96_10590 [Acidobacteriaceae bacterium]|nr:hypothetical protein [Acidobacteriaceae bacterium]
MHRYKRDWSRRRFLQSSGSAVALGLAGAATPWARAQARGVSLAADPADPVAGAAPSLWAAGELERSLASRGIAVSRCERLAQAKAGDLCIVAAGVDSAASRRILKSAKATVATAPEALGLIPGEIEDRRVLLACGSDVRGLVYALLELADRVQHGSSVMEALAFQAPVTELPANEVRSLTRLFTSDVEDKPWYNDREMWPAYLTMLAAQRFNRFNLALGIGYDFLRQVTDAYFLFAYPFLVSVPGYNVRVPQLPDAERESNLEMLRFISEQTVARGMRFQLGIWMHGYQWIDSPNPNYTIEGLSAETHAPYCRDAVRMLLKECPAISGITFRVHGESGVPEGSYGFWGKVFDGVATCGRKVDLDMHPKGMDQGMIDTALATHEQITQSPKFWAEHMGMAYHQADIREIEQPKPGHQASGLMKLSGGSRSFLRYGYGDLLREDRSWQVVHRIWPGTQRLLLWGDPVSAAGYSRAFSFCGSNGVEIMEPLSFKGRRGSGIAGDRCAYADASLRTRWDWQKYEYGHRVWGRLLYNPAADPDAWRRLMRSQFAGGADDLEEALANASRILPIVTTAHAPSAGNNTYWPEIYLNQSLVDADHPGPYTDTPAPKVFGNVSPLDPQLFSRMNDFAGELLGDAPGGKYSPIEVAQWIEDYSAAATRHLAAARVPAGIRRGPEYRRLEIDISIQAGLGVFFAAKFRSGVLYGIHERTGDRAALEASLQQYQKARAAWAALAGRAKGVYMSDITVGELPQLRGHWLDRLPAMDRDIAAVSEKLSAVPPGASQPQVKLAVAKALGRPAPRTAVGAALGAGHDAPAEFHPGEPLALQLALRTQAKSVCLYYRHVNQAERYKRTEMQAQEHLYQAAIPADYTASEYPLEYYFEIQEADLPTPTLYPGFSAELTNQPYFVVRQAGKGGKARS